VLKPISADVLDFDEVMAAYEAMMDWLARTYVNALNIIHYMHDKYAYEKIEMALHDRDVFRTMACGIAGLSVAADSLSAIKHAGVQVVRDENGLAVDYKTEGDYPKFGNNDDRVDELAVWITTRPATHPTGGVTASLSPRGPTRCTAGIPREPWPPWHQWPSCRTRMPRTASPTPFRSYRMHWAAPNRTASRTSRRCWTATTPTAASISTST
jgi:hypothetical protein